MAGKAEKYRRLLNSLEEAGALLDRKGRIQHSNSIFRDLFAEKPEGKGLKELLPEIDPNWLLPSLQSGEVSAFLFDSPGLGADCLATLLPGEEFTTLMLWPGNATRMPSLDQLQNLVPFGLALISDDGSILQTNAACRRLLDLSGESENLNTIWNNSRDRSGRKRPLERAPWNRALEPGNAIRNVRMGPVQLSGSILELHCIPIQSDQRRLVLVVLQDMHREQRNQKRLRDALELNRSINTLLMDLLRVPGPEDTIHRALQGALELIGGDECLLITEEDGGSRIAFVEGSRQDLIEKQSNVDPWILEPGLQKEGAFLIRRVAALDSLIPGIQKKYRGCLAASVLYEKDRRGLVLLLQKDQRFKSRERRILQLLVPALSAAIFKFRYEARLNRLATTDPLTGLLNRRRFFAILESAVRENTPPALLQMDLDWFKQINDSLGHQAGDRVLEVLAAELKRWEEKGAVAARTGGEEFMVLLRGKMAEKYRKVAEELRQAVEKLKIEWDPDPIRFTVSIGGTRYVEGEKLSDFYARADKLLYEAKEGGRNQVCFETVPLNQPGR
ncbi:MAG: sensor domain-containing diguanylate cyclase [Leptospiraceae bacterium]|nr:sensor domain-containing diguanylate cyclase [Leptospiraceae bacterium]